MLTNFENFNSNIVRSQHK